MKSPMRPKSVRVSDSLWASALAKADERNETLAEIIRIALEGYVKSK